MSAQIISTIIFTIDHGEITADQFENILLKNSIATLIDIRSQPLSPHYEHFNEDKLRASMQQCKIDYHWAGRQLGGKRDQKISSKHVSLTSEQQAFADYMDDPNFVRAITQLISFAARTQLAIMCSDEHKDNCHRFMIADYLLLNGIDVRHIEHKTDPGSGTFETQAHALSSAARKESSQLIYDYQ